MFHSKLKARALSQVTEKKRRFASKIPFQQEVRNKRQHVSFGLPKINTDQDRRSESKSAESQDSPTTQQQAQSEVRSIYCKESRLGKDTKSKQVQFAEGTKDWNGLRVERHFYDELVYQFFVMGKQFSSVDVLRLTGIDASVVSGVCVLLKELCTRIEDFSTSEEVGVPVLILGGGHGMKVSCFHLPYLQSLHRVVAEAERIVSLGISLNSSSSSPKQGAGIIADEGNSNNLPVPTA